MTQSKPLLTIAIPTWNNFKQLSDLLYTLVTYCEFPYKIVVVNNGADRDPDGRDFEQDLHSRIPFPNLEVLTPGRNLGWQKAINLAFERSCDTPYFCMANDDLVFPPGSKGFWWELCHSFQFSEVGAAGPASNYVMGSQSIFDHRGWMLFESTLLIGFLMVVRTAAFSEIGGLDETLPGGDDLDLSILLRDAGYRLVVNRGCYVHHIGSQTGARIEGGYWNSPAQVEITNNALIRKHGVRKWYDCVSSHVRPFEPETQMADVEGDIIRERIGTGRTGLDVGCGSNKTIADAIGIDHDPPGTIGTAGGRKQTQSVADLVTDCNDLPIPSDSQDYVIARHIFEHMDDPVKALEEWKRVLKPDGTLVIACPDENACNSMLLDSTHKHAWTPASFRNLAGKVGLVATEEYLVRPGISFVTFLEKCNGG